MSYSAAEVIYNMNHALGPILFAGAFIFVGYYIVYLEGIRLGFRDKTHAIPVPANMYFFAHDVIFLALFSRWFFEVDHWLYKAFWIGVVVFTIFESIVHYQTLKYSQSELFPQLGRRQYWLVYAALQLFIGVLFLLFYSMIDDYFFLISFSSTIVVSVIFMLPMLYRRNSGRGQSRFLALGLIISGLGFFFLFLPAMSSSFWSAPYWLAGVFTIGLASIYLWRLTTFKPKSAATVSTPAN